ncbi:MAG TPA: beta-ketoacyl-[acyl-carrier-protein] synthase family protein [Methylomirabilota bacterium]|nr:beta-ketoacyl-[acyl-carrier-protein] synthase family protein [Methylomirabilota bacterium]
MERRVVITGIGLVSPIGVGKEPFWRALVEGRSGIRRLSRFDPQGYDCQVAGEILDESYKELIDVKRRRRMTHVAQLAVAGAHLALEDAGLCPDWPNPSAVGTIVGTSLGTVREVTEQQSILLERGAARINPFLTVASHINAISTEVAITARAQGPALTVAGGCASSLCALGVAADMIRSGALDICLSGGAESPLFPLVYAGLCRTQELTGQNECPERASRPFDHAHDGLVVSEGSCLLILEERVHAERRGARIYGEILGHAFGCEAYESFALEPSGESAVRLLQETFARSGISPEKLDWVNAHGSSCPNWDRKETRILKRTLGEAAYRVPISATKSVMGHTFGAAAAFQVASALLAMQHGSIPPTINLDAPDPECDLDYVPHRARPLRVNVCLVNAFAYGGINSFMVLHKGLAPVIRQPEPVEFLPSAHS